MVRSARLGFATSIVLAAAFVALWSTSPSGDEGMWSFDNPPLALPFTVRDHTHRRRYVPAIARPRRPGGRGGFHRSADRVRA